MYNIIQNLFHLSEPICLSLLNNGSDIPVDTKYLQYSGIKFPKSYRFQLYRVVVVTTSCEPYTVDCSL